MANTPSEKLSGGEKARLLLGLATLNAPHLIILDEPTNHLDIDSRAALIEAINDFPGAVILISHDRHLLEACADQLWLVENGTVVTYDGDLDDYRKLVLSARGVSRPGAEQAAADGAPEEKVTRADARRAAAERRLELAPLRREIVAAEKEIAHLTARIAQLDATLASPGLLAQQVAELGKTRVATMHALTAIEAKWLELSERYEEGAPRAKNYAP
jgi:ATP-binding cassette subfamily F protein 3